MNKEKTFEVKNEHIKLLRAAYVGWDDGEFGAPAIDCKRPYGNSSVYSDINKILDYRFRAVDSDDDFSDAAKGEMGLLHSGTKTALQIFLATGEMKAGIYTAYRYGENWKIKQ